MYDDLMEKDPKMQKIRAESEAKGKAEGEAKGKAEGTQAVRMMIVEMVQMRFPPLVKLAQQRVNQLSTIKDLHTLFRQVNMVHDEQEARAVLESPLT